MMKNSFAAKLILSVAVSVAAGLFCGSLTPAAYAASENVQQLSTAAKSDAAPCQGMNQNLSEKSKADVAHAIVKQINAAEKIKASSVDVLQSLIYGKWSIFYVSTHVSDETFFFYSGNPLTNRYVGRWSGAGYIEDEPRIKDWVFKNVPGIPPQLASCFTWSATKGRYKAPPRPLRRRHSAPPRPHQ